MKTATIVVRLVLVPATVTLLGRFNWWLPARLDRVLVELRVEHGGGSPVASPEPEGALA